MFFGEFEYKIDEKGRVPVPPRFRKELSTGVVLTPGIERCVTVYPLPAWKKIAQTFTNDSISRSKQRRLNRAVFATAFQLSIDGQGRIALPAPLREYANLQDEIIIAGVNNYLEIWDRQDWETEKATSQEQAWQTIESMEER